MDEIGKGCKLWLPALFISSVPANKKQDQPVEEKIGENAEGVGQPRFYCLV
jgi:hypothetical protein